jgi:hypothetical protein
MPCEDKNPGIRSINVLVLCGISHPERSVVAFKKKKNLKAGDCDPYLAKGIYLLK